MSRREMTRKGMRVGGVEESRGGDVSVWKAEGAGLTTGEKIKQTTTCSAKVFSTFVRYLREGGVEWIVSHDVA